MHVGRTPFVYGILYYKVPSPGTEGPEKTLGLLPIESELFLKRLGGRKPHRAPDAVGEGETYPGVVEVPVEVEEMGLDGPLLEAEGGTPPDVRHPGNGRSRDGRLRDVDPVGHEPVDADFQVGRGEAHELSAPVPADDVPLAKARAAEHRRR